MKIWNYKNADKKKAVELANECNIDVISALLLISKNIDDPMLADEFLSDEINVCDPYSFVDMDKAVERILTAVDKFEPIAVYGDYDCDGVTSTALVYSVLCEMGANVQWRVPSRDRGYGISVTAVEELIENNIKLIITVDNGITAFEAIDYANENGIDVVVTDHHIPSEKLPNAYAIVDPKRSDCLSDFKDLAGVGVAFMLCCAVSEMPCDEMLYKYGDFVAIGTIADVMPLVVDNRTLVKQGLNLINRNPKAGISALIDIAGLKKGSLTSTNVAFGLAPRINASGRMLHPKKAVELLLCEDYDDATIIAKELNEANILRRKTEQEIFEQAIELVEENKLMQNAPVIIVSGEGWHYGVIGIVAAKLCEYYSRPAIAFSIDENEAVGSCRSYKGVSIYEILLNANGIDKFGGHESAAGLTVDKNLLSQAIRSIELSAKQLYPIMGFDNLDISFKLNPSALSLSNVYSQKLLEPFGCQNETPIFALCDMILISVTPLSGGKHLRLSLSRNPDKDQSINVMKFFTEINEFCYPPGTKLNVAVTIDSNVYKGTEQLSIVVKDIKPCEFSIDNFFERIRDYQNFKYFGDFPEFVPITRADIVLIYKLIKKKKQIECDEQGLLFIFKNDDYFKIMIILDILEELDFINIYKDKRIRIHYIENAKSKELGSSKIFTMFQKDGDR